MGEYIKREDALDAVLFALVGTGYQSRATDAIRYIPTADVAPRAEWISVEERMPKNFESVLVLATRLEDDEYDVLVAYHDRGDWEEQHTRRYESPICGEIKYWMPLPEPLEGD